MKRVLIIAYYWPPASGPGVQRWLKFVKYLQEFGWEPLILTVTNGSYPAMDYSLEAEIPKDIKVFKTKSIEPNHIYNLLRGQKGNKTSVGLDQSIKSKSWFKSKVGSVGMHIRANYFIPDARMAWRYTALPKAKKIIQKYKPHCIVTTGPPHSVHLIGLKLKKKYDIPWAADLRDPWTKAYYNNQLTRSSKAIKKDSRLEDQVISNANLITVVSPGMKEEFADRNNSIEVLYNGYDEEDFDGLALPRNDGKFVLQYVGSYKSTEIHLDLWFAIKESIEENEDFADSFQLIFTGNATEAVKESITKVGLDSHTTFKGFVAHEEAIQDMVNANLLLFIVADLPGSHKVVTGKIFEYLASQTPILGIGIKDGGADEVLIDSGRNGLIGYHERKKYKSVLLSSFNIWKDKKNPSFNNVDHQNYSRRGITKKLAILLDAMV